MQGGFLPLGQRADSCDNAWLPLCNQRRWKARSSRHVESYGQFIDLKGGHHRLHCDSHWGWSQPRHEWGNDVGWYKCLNRWKMAWCQMHRLPSQFKCIANFCVCKYRRMSPYHESFVDMMNRKSSRRSSLGVDDTVNGGRSVMSLAITSPFVLFWETNSKSNSWRMATHLTAWPCRRWQLKRYRIGFESATTWVWFVMK